MSTLRSGIPSPSSSMFKSGIPSLFVGEIAVSSFNYIDMFTMIGSAILLFILTFKNKVIGKREGIIMLLLFMAYYSYVIVGGI